MEEADEMAESLGRFRELAGPVAREPGDIALEEGAIHLADAIALPLQPLGIVFSGTEIELDTTRCIPLVLEGGCKVIQVRPQRTAPQPGNHGCADKGVFEHTSLLFLHG
jgi:hypothetical protein